ncbi:tetratricopeptide repeat protein [Siminovitchia terrae]|uniref:Tetratricopeptide repeat protein n=1 Tax=Siminovitchia terrae TaxID=1914933 RepID=A0A429XAK2_SIMTE|nr:tetratricopeptide repeat protein [Siminovitchia terrae]RST60454.1 tetratricopeptide repeat protein [Siminovitchia terrae]
MMNIEENKLQMPNYSPSLKRKRLFNELDQHEKVSLLLVTGDSGYGKTMLISSYICEKRIPAVWYQLGSSDRYAHIFLSYVKTGISRQLGIDHSPQILEAEEVDSELATIVSILADRKEPLLLVFDDYQLVDSSPEIEPIINELIHTSPAVTVIIISRGLPRLPIAKLKVERKYKELTTADLAFTLDETCRFFNEMNQLNLENQEVQFIFERTEGWIASYQLILGVIAKMNVKERLSLWSTFPYVQDIYDYLSVEVLQAQPEEVKHFLYKTSLLTELDPVVIDEFLGIDYSEKILSRLLTQHLFVYRDQQGMIRYHRLFRQYLYQNYKNKIKNDYMKEHLRLATIYEERYQLINSFAHYTIGKDYLKAAKVMGLIRDLYNPVESMLFLDGWLEEISAGDSFANNTLFLIRCVPLATLKELTTLFEENISLLRKKKNELWLCNLQHRLATIYLMRGDIVKAKQLFSDSLKGSEQFHDHAMSALNLILLAEIYRYLRKDEEAIEHVRKAVFISERYKIKHTQIHALDTLATIYLDKEKVDKAAPYIQLALNIAKEHDKSSLTFIYTTMGRLYSVKNDGTKAIEWGEKAVSLAESFNNDFDNGWSKHELGKSYLKCKKFEEAKRCFEQASEAFSLFTHYQCMVEISLYHLYTVIGDKAQAAKTYSEIKNTCEKYDFYWLLDGSKPKAKVKNLKERPKQLTIHTLGNFNVCYENKPITIKRQSSLRLLQFFITHRNKKIEKDMIIDTVFPDGSLSTIDNHFNVSLSVLRKTLEPNLKSGVHSRFIKRFGNQYLFDTTDVDLDIETFMTLTKKGDDADINNLEEAVKLFRGDYFEEYPYEAMLENERERLRVLFVKTSQTLAQHYFEQNHYKKCFEYFERILDKDPYQEDIYFDYLEMLLKKNLVTKATKVASDMKQFFTNEMGISVNDQIENIFSKFSVQMHG